MSGNIRLNWTLPSERIDGSELLEDDISHTSIRMRVQGAPGFTEINQVASPSVTLLIPDQPAGNYEFQAVTVDDDGLESAPAVGAINVPNEAPGAPQNFTVGLE